MTAKRTKILVVSKMKKLTALASNVPCAMLKTPYVSQSATSCKG
jgi:hypothetical protein